MVGGGSAGNAGGGREEAAGLDWGFGLRERDWREGVRRHARASVGVGLEAAKFVSAYQRPAALRVARQITRASGSRIGEPAVAMREGIKVVVTGASRRRGPSHHFRQGRRPGNGQGGLRHPGQRDSRDGVLGAAGELAAISDRRSVKPGRSSRARRSRRRRSTPSPPTPRARRRSARAATRSDRAVPGGDRTRSELRPGLRRLGHGGNAAGPARGSRPAVEDRAGAARPDERPRALPAARRLLHARHPQLRHGDRDLREPGARLPGRRRRAQQPGGRLLPEARLQAGARGRRQLLDIYSSSPLYRTNYALYAMYAGDFETAAKEAQALVDQSRPATTPTSRSRWRRWPGATRPARRGPTRRWRRQDRPDGRWRRSAWPTSRSAKAGSARPRRCSARRSRRTGRRRTRRGSPPSNRAGRNAGSPGGVPAALVAAQSALGQDRSPAVAVPAARC